MTRLIPPPRLRWTFMSLRGGWSDQVGRSWERSGRDGLDVTSTEDLSFLPRVPGLRALRYLGRAKDDLPVEACEELEYLDLDTRDSRRLDLSGLHRLETLALDRPQGLVLSPQAPLADLSLGRMPVADLTFLRPRTRSSLRWLSMRDWGSAGVECFQVGGELPALVMLKVGGVAVAPDLRSLDGVPDLRFLGLVSSGLRPPPGTLDLAPLTSLPSLHEVQIKGFKVTGLADLRQSPSLRRLQLWNCQVDMEEVEAVRGRLDRLDIF